MNRNAVRRTPGVSPVGNVLTGHAWLRQYGRDSVMAMRCPVVERANPRRSQRRLGSRPALPSCAQKMIHVFKRRGVVRGPGNAWQRKRRQASLDFCQPNIPFNPANFRQMRIESSFQRSGRLATSAMSSEGPGDDGSRGEGSRCGAGSRCRRTTGGRRALAGTPGRPVGPTIASDLRHRARPFERRNR